MNKYQLLSTEYLFLSAVMYILHPLGIPTT
jgi:hypothetical protein